MNGSTMYRNVALLVLIALASSAFGIPGREEMEAAKEKCAAEVGLDPASFKGPPPPPPDESKEHSKMHCFGACMMKQFGVMNEDGTPNVEKAIEELPADIPEREKIIEAYKECSTLKDENDCETAHKIFKCLREKKATPWHGHGPHHHR